jgi:histidine triad (HIT) family protein
MKKNCVFCDLVEGKVKFPGLFWENKKYMAFLSGRPNTKGFSVVIPKKHYGGDVLAMPNKDFQDFLIVAKNVSKKLEKHFKDVGRVGIIMEGMGIDHAHIKLFPMHGTGNLKKDWKPSLSKTNKYFEKYVGYIASNTGPRANPSEIKKLAAKLSKVK